MLNSSYVVQLILVLTLISRNEVCCQSEGKCSRHFITIKKLFIAEVQNATSEPYFPIDDMNDEMLNEFSSSGEYVLIDAAAREKILKEITYQNDGMVNPAQAKMIGKQSGADALIFGNIQMKPESRDGKTIKQYSLNIRFTELETSNEIARLRAKTQKYSEQKSTGW